MNQGRKIKTSLTFSQKNVDVYLRDCLESVSYTDVASGSSDTLSISLCNINDKWINAWYPQKGNTVGGKIIFTNWSKGKDKNLQCGTFTLDDIRVNFCPDRMELSCLSAPANESFKVRDRHKTWEKVTISQIASEICSRYGLTLSYSAPVIMIDKKEQSGNDSAFLSQLCDDYGLGMKIYRRKIVIYDMVAIEKKKAIARLDLKDFEEGISFTDGIYGTYTGARISYKTTDSDKEISVYVGNRAETAKGSRVMNISETCGSEADARRKAAAKVNKSNMSATTFSGSIFPNPKICAGVTIRLGKEFGKLSGKYFVDKVSWSVGESATKQSIEAHKVKKKVNA